ncbi:MAG: 4Fe-4S dicluster domain-containing protein [Clostridia bacterium]|nr:4Fe-4S dicluster domain-containing protein [Clostridia bacterium]
MAEKVWKFDTKAQRLKYRVLREVAREAWRDNLTYEALADIPMRIAPGKVPTMRCCIYKERAILGERIKLAMGGDKQNPNVIEVIEIACDECPSSGYEVIGVCRGCLSHRCKAVCKQGAVTFDSNHVAHIDKSKCIECGMCAKACPFGAIINHKRPCEMACKVNAISESEDHSAQINNDKCIKCGACVYQCPFGAISDKSYILDAIDIIKKSDNNKNYKVYAIVAPTVVGQFNYATLGQGISGMKQIGFFSVVEAALGADMVALKEAEELAEKDFLTSSCCPAFVDYVKQNFPELAEHISHNYSPMAVLAKWIKQHDDNCKVIFIGPCTAKKDEYKKEGVREWVDCVITFEELQALFAGRDLDIAQLEESSLSNASYFGRIFGKSGGLSQAVKQALKEQNTQFEVNPVICSGIEECKIALLKKKKGVLDANFIEGMACLGGCIGGGGCITHSPKVAVEIEKFGKMQKGISISESVSKAKT